MTKDYYVVWDEQSWRVKLEAGRYIDTFGSFDRAKREAIRMAIRNNRGLAINAKEGYTRRNLSPQDVREQYGNKRWTPAV